MEKRCAWVNLKNPKYIKYHDEEWGIPTHDDRMLFELLILEGFQAGLSWECVLNKRDAFKLAFDNFDPLAVSRYDDSKCEELCSNKDIIRNRRKIYSAVTNAQVFLDIQKEFGSFNNYIWGYVDFEPIYEEYTLRTTSPLSDTISKDLKSRGMKFVGSTIIYSYLQAIGIINGHGKECERHVSPNIKAQL